MTLVSRLSSLVTLLWIFLTLAACSGVPSHVIQPEEMAQIMADIHTGESVVEMNYDSYQGDSVRLALKESIYSKHGVTQAQVDTSFMWYGRNIGKYMDVYDRTVEILEDRLAEKGHLAAVEASMSAGGDSVDVWPGPRALLYSHRMPTPIVTFNLKKDPNWEKGDVYTLRAKFIAGGVGATWSILADYTDGTTEHLGGTIGNPGWNELTFFADSTRTLDRVYGSLRLNNTPAAAVSSPSNIHEHDLRVWIDSLSLTRNRLNPRYYNQRYRQRSYNYKR